MLLVYMRVLVISQVVFSRTNNTGKTLSSYFRGFHSDEVAQLYFHSEIPTDKSICTNYYRFNDVDAIKSIFNRKVRGKSFCASDIRTDISNGRTDTGIKRRAYMVGSKHTPIALFLRDLIWKLSNWKNNNLFEWIEQFNPDVIFFLSGDGSFTYRICQYIAKKYSIPFISMCVDDYYINNRNKGRLFANLQHRSFMKTVNKCYKNTYCILTICDKMRGEYGRLFNKKCYTLHTSASNKKIASTSSKNRLSYMGNVGYKRYEQLIMMGRALNSIVGEKLPKTIDIYSGSLNPEFINPLRNAQGVSFHGEKSPEELLNIMSESIAVIHTESFDPIFMDLTRYSVSTKIAESLMYGPCLIAYGPEGIASIDYLKENKAAYVITRSEDLESGLQEILTNAELREQIVENARRLAAKNHDEAVNPTKVREWLQMAINDHKEGE